MTFKPENYPHYWKMFSEYIRFERAGNQCEKCNAPNGWYRVYGFHGEIEIAKHNDVFDLDFEVEKFSKIVLTVAHLDYSGGICDCKKIYGFKCAKPSHVLALCQSCHLSMDRFSHLKVQAENRAKKKDAARGLFELV